MPPAGCRRKLVRKCRADLRVARKAGKHVGIDSTLGRIEIKQGQEQRQELIPFAGFEGGFAQHQAGHLGGAATLAFGQR